MTQVYNNYRVIEQAYLTLRDSECLNEDALTLEGLLPQKAYTDFREAVDSVKRYANAYLERYGSERDKCQCLEDDIAHLSETRVRRHRRK